MNRVLLLLLAIAAISCEKKPLTPQEMILGNWAVQDTFKKGSFLDCMYGDDRGFEFLPDSICDYKLGYYDQERHMNDADEYVRYDLGTQTKYALTIDSLKVFNLSEKKWDSYRIKKLTKDSLVISRDTSWATFVKKDYKTEDVPDFDAVLVSSTPCYGSCPMLNIMIDKSGDVRYEGYYHTINRGDYTAKISKANFDKIALRFKQANYMKLDNNYFKPVTDSRRVSVSFIKNGRIIKSITDYAASSPDEFLWAYHPLLTLDQKLDMKPVQVPKYLKTRFFGGVIENSSSFIDISNSEMYFLMNQIQKVKETSTVFEEDYTFKPDNDLVEKVTTDGKHYKFYFKDGKSKTFDIGYNFLLDNKLSHKFELYKK